jgi:hypothetical protein
MEALHPQKLALTSPTSGGRSVGLVRSRTQATEFLKTEAIRSSETSVYNKPTWRYIPEDGILHNFLYFPT